jgi:hypothetical protein
MTNKYILKYYLFKKTFSKINGGDRRDRTDDLLNANQTLFQLSYIPKIKFMAERTGFEPAEGLTPSTV